MVTETVTTVAAKPTTPAPTARATTPATVEGVARETATRQSEPATTPAASGASREHEAALESARRYLSFSNFSRQGLYDQLIYEEFPPEAAQHAVDTVQTDWNANAVGAAGN